MLLKQPYYYIRTLPDGGIIYSCANCEVALFQIGVDSDVAPTGANVAYPEIIFNNPLFIRGNDIHAEFFMDIAHTSVKDVKLNAYFCEKDDIVYQNLQCKCRTSKVYIFS